MHDYLLELVLLVPLVPLLLPVLKVHPNQGAELLGKGFKISRLDINLPKF